MPAASDAADTKLAGPSALKADEGCFGIVCAMAHFSGNVLADQQLHSYRNMARAHAGTLC